MCVCVCYVSTIGSNSRLPEKNESTGSQLAALSFKTHQLSAGQLLMSSSSRRRAPATTTTTTTTTLNHSIGDDDYDDDAGDGDGDDYDGQVRSALGWQSRAALIGRFEIP